MSLNKTTQHIKIDEHNHGEKTHLNQLYRPGWVVIALMQDLLLGKKRVTPLLTESQETGA